jgi:hypothetical protein
VTPGATHALFRIDATSQLLGFPFDGIFSNSFRDFFIISIGASPQAAYLFWRIFRNKVFASRGGCQKYTTSEDRGLWAVDALETNVFLKVS